MTLTKRGLVALDLSTLDDRLLSYSKLFARLLALDKLTFIHVIPTINLTETTTDLPSAIAPLEMKISQRVETQIRKKLDQQFSDKEKELELNVKILEGSPYQSIIEWTKTNDLDLLITGRKKKSEGSGITARRIAQRTECNVLFVPENAVDIPSKVLVPIDFSAHSARALQTALNLKYVIPSLEIVAVNVIEMLSKEYYLGVAHTPVYRDQLLAKNHEAYDSFLKEHQIKKEDIRIFFLENAENNTANQLYHYTKDQGYNLVIMGASGHSVFENFLYGSITERLVDLCCDIPVFVVR